MSTSSGSTEKTVHFRLEPAETEWEMAPGQVVTGYAYNGQIPGPVLEANVGDTLSLGLANALPEPTSIY
jgi:FtsP/CotA-like multicopper oxidase with cupredoxin domain